MGIFNKLKNMFGGSNSKEEVEETTVEEIKEEVEQPKKKTKKVKKEKKVEDIKIYDKGLSKSRGGFVSRLQDLTKKYSKINSDYFDELEEILIMADVGVNTVMELIDKLKKRVYTDKIIDP